MLNESLNIYITNIDEENIEVIKNEYDKELKIENNVIHMEIPKTLNSNTLVTELHDFLGKYKDMNKHQLSSSCVFDEDNLVLIRPEKTDYLTSKEAEFLKCLIKSNKIITYDYMSELLWNDNDISQNALRLFVKNLNKKLPPKTLKNIRGVGYKLNTKF
jgi:DNA-binding response OmpR family regulator